MNWRAIKKRAVALKTEYVETETAAAGTIKLLSIQYIVRGGWVW